MIKREIWKINRESWDIYVSKLEHDLHGRQNMIYKIIKHRSTDKEEKYTIIVENWRKYYQNLWINLEEKQIQIKHYLPASSIDFIEIKELNVLIGWFPKPPDIVYSTFLASACLANWWMNPFLRWGHH